MKETNGGFFIFFLLGKNRVDFQKAKNITSKKLSVASPKEVKEVAGLDPGAVCPILLKTSLIVDKRVLALDNVNFGSGNHLYGLEMNTSDFLKVINYTVADIAE